MPPFLKFLLILCYLLLCCLSEAVLFEVRTHFVQSDLHSRRCLFDYAQSTCGGEKKIKKKGRVGKKFSWVGEKNTLLKKMLSALACAFFKSVFFCGWFITPMIYLFHQSFLFVFSQTQMADYAIQPTHHLQF